MQEMSELGPRVAVTGYCYARFDNWAKCAKTHATVARPKQPGDPPKCNWGGKHILKKSRQRGPPPPRFIPAPSPMNNPWRPLKDGTASGGRAADNPNFENSENNYNNNFPRPPGQRRRRTSTRNATYTQTSTTQTSPTHNYNNGGGESPLSSEAEEAAEVEECSKTEYNSCPSEEETHRPSAQPHEPSQEGMCKQENSSIKHRTNKIKKRAIDEPARTGGDEQVQLTAGSNADAGESYSRIKIKAMKIWERVT